MDDRVQVASEDLAAVASWLDKYPNLVVEIASRIGELGRQPYTVQRGDRIAQMVINKVYQAEVREVNQLEETDRNTGGFGHTGS